MQFRWPGFAWVKIPPKLLTSNQTTTTNNNTTQLTCTRELPQSTNKIGDAPSLCSVTCTTQLARQGKDKSDPTTGAWNEEVETIC